MHLIYIIYIFNVFQNDYYPRCFLDYPSKYFCAFVCTINERKLNFLGNYCINLILIVSIISYNALDLAHPLYFSEKTRFSVNKLQCRGK